MRPQARCAPRTHTTHSLGAQAPPTASPAIHQRLLHQGHHLAPLVGPVRTLQLAARASLVREDRTADRAGLSSVDPATTTTNRCVFDGPTRSTELECETCRSTATTEPLPPRQGSDDPSDCKPCTKGRYSSLQGIPYVEDCVLCPRGTASSIEGRTLPCDDCNTGYFQPSGGASGCVACPAGKTSPSFGPQVSCSVCAAGKYLNATSKLCDLCGVGKFSQGVETTSNTTECNACPKGRYSAQTGSVECQACKAGRYNSKQGSTSPDACTPCPTGTYSTAEPSTSDASCVKCPSGFFNDGEGANTESACTFLD